MSILMLMDAVCVNDTIDIELYNIEKECTVFEGKYDGFQPREIIPKKYWDLTVDSFQFDKNYLCINY